MKKRNQFVWTKTNVPNLYRHLNRRYYARLFVAGKEIWKSLKTSLKSVAQKRLTEQVANARQQRQSGIRVSSGSPTFVEVVAIYRQNFLRDADVARLDFFAPSGSARDDFTTDGYRGEKAACANMKYKSITNQGKCK